MIRGSQGDLSETAKLLESKIVEEKNEIVSIK